MEREGIAEAKRKLLFIYLYRKWVWLLNILWCLFDWQLNDSDDCQEMQFQTNLNLKYNHRNNCNNTATLIIQNPFTSSIYKMNRRCTPPHYHVLTHFERWDGETVAVSMTAQLFLHILTCVLNLCQVMRVFCSVSQGDCYCDKCNICKKKKKTFESFLSFCARYTSVVFLCCARKEKKKPADRKSLFFLSPWPLSQSIR